jgi:hypothetical protein
MFLKWFLNLIINLLLFIIQNICIYNYKEKKPKRTPPIRWFIASLLDKRPLEVEIKKYITLFKINKQIKQIKKIIKKII